MKRVLGVLWSFPLGLVGLAAWGVFGLLGWSARSEHLGWGVRVVYTRGRLSRWIGRVRPGNRRWCAHTMGWTILLWDHGTGANPGPWPSFVLPHELVHVQQAYRLGVFLIPAYLYWSLKVGYRDNPFEVEARRIGGV